MLKIKKFIRKIGNGEESKFQIGGTLDISQPLASIIYRIGNKIIKPIYAEN